MTVREVRRWVRQYRSGMTVQAIATQAKRSHEAVRVHLIRAGVYEGQYTTATARAALARRMEDR